MIKIGLSKSLIEKHNEYFKCNVLESLNQKSSINFSDVNLVEASKLLNKKITLPEDIQFLHNKFIEFCIKNYETLAIGTPNELTELVDIIREKHKEMLAIMQSNLHTKKTIENKETKRDEFQKFGYSEQIQKIFGYKKFSSVGTPYELVRNLSFKRYKAKYGSEPERYSSELYPYAKDILVEVFNVDSELLDSNLIQKKLSIFLRIIIII